MSYNSELENNGLQDSPQSSPENAMGSSSDAQSHQSNSSAFENVSDHSSPGPSRFSPPSSPVRRGRKRPKYGDYKDDPTIPVPRQTLHSQKRKRAESHSSDSSSDDSSDNEKSTAKGGDNEENLFTTGESHQIYFEEENLDQTGNMSQSSLESSESGEDDSGSEFNFSNSSYSNCSNSDVNDENNGSDSEIEGSGNDPSYMCTWTSYMALE